MKSKEGLKIIFFSFIKSHQKIPQNALFCCSLVRQL